MKQSIYKTTYIVKERTNQSSLSMFDKSLFRFRSKWSAHLFIKCIAYKKDINPYYVEEAVYQKK